MLRCFFSQPAFSAPSWRLGEAGRHDPRDTSLITMLFDLADDTYTTHSIFFKLIDKQLKAKDIVCFDLFTICLIVCFLVGVCCPSFFILNAHSALPGALVMTAFYPRLLHLHIKGNTTAEKQQTQKLRGKTPTHTHTDSQTHTMHSLGWQGYPPFNFRGPWNRLIVQRYNPAE